MIVNTAFPLLFDHYDIAAIRHYFNHSTGDILYFMDIASQAVKSNLLPHYHFIYPLNAYEYELPVEKEI